MRVVLWLAILVAAGYVTLRLIAGRRRATHQEMLADFVADAPQFMQDERRRIAERMSGDLAEGVRADSYRDAA